MILSEEQARTKWCPFARVAYGAGFQGAIAFNRIPDRAVNDVAGCIASDCMAWRDGGEDPDGQREAEREFSRTGRRMKVARVGFCGLAGRF